MKSSNPLGRTFRDPVERSYVCPEHHCLSQENTSSPYFFELYSIFSILKCLHHSKLDIGLALEGILENKECSEKANERKTEYFRFLT